MVVAAYLMKQKGMTLKEALGQIIRARPQVSPNAGFLQQLKDLDMELYGSVSLEVEDLPKREKDRLALFAEGTEGPLAWITDAQPAAPATAVKDTTVIAPDMAASMPVSSDQGRPSCAREEG